MKKSSPQLVTEAVNEFYLPADRGDNQPGVICAANEARFTASHYSEPLTQYTVGWRDPDNLDALLETIAPQVPVGRRFEFKKADNAEAFLSEDDDVRAIGSAFKRVEYKGSTVNEKTLNKGLTIRLDKDDLLGSGDEETAVARLMARLNRNEVRRALALIDAASTNAAKTWNSSANPDGDVRAALKLGADASGIRPNRVLFAEAAMDLRLDVYEAQDTPYAGRAASMTKEQLAAKYMVDVVETVKARYQSTASAKGGVMTTLTVLLYLALNGAGKDDPSNVKRFITPVGSRFRVFRQESDKFIDLSVEHYSNIVITSTLGIRKLTVAAS
jgi:hypothetical protein